MPDSPRRRFETGTPTANPAAAPIRMVATVPPVDRSSSRYLSGDMPRTCGGRCWRRIAYRDASRELPRRPGCKKKATYRMRVEGTERHEESHDEQRVPTRRAVLWGVIGL